MDISSLVDLKRMLNEHQVLISFSGPFSHSVIEELGKAVRRHLEEQQVSKSELMDLFSVFIEQSQNVRNYTAEGPIQDERLLHSGIVVISRNDRYTVSSGNLLRRADSAALGQRIDQLQSLDRQALRKLFKEVARKPLIASGRSAGLGLISMARTTSVPLEYAITPVDDEYDFFSLKAGI